MGGFSNPIFLFSTVSTLLGVVLMLHMLSIFAWYGRKAKRGYWLGLTSLTFFCFWGIGAPICQFFVARQMGPESFATYIVVSNAIGLILNKVALGLLLYGIVVDRDSIHDSRSEDSNVVVDQNKRTSFNPYDPTVAQR